MRTPLAGHVVVTIAQNTPGPVACARLRDLGATVVKVEPPAGDPLATYAPAWYAELHRRVDVHALDLRSELGRVAIGELCDAAHVLVTAQRPAALGRLGLDLETLRTRHPQLCGVAIVGHGGADAELPGHDLTYLAEQGLVDPVAAPRTLAADLAGAERVVSEVLALRLADARGVHVEVALADIAAALAAPLRHGLTTPNGLLGGGSPRYGVYATADGYVAIAALEQRLAEALRATLGTDMLDRDTISSALRTRGADDWERRAREHGAPLVALARQPRAEGEG